VAGQIVAIGGGGFMDSWSVPMDDFVHGLSGRERPRVCLIATASGDSDLGIVRFYRRWEMRSRATHLPLFNRPGHDLRELLLAQDVIYVSGGNTANMLAIWRLHGVDVILREAWRLGALLAGWSAGSICWFESGVTDSFGPELVALEGCLGFLAGSNCPHYDAEPQRRPVYQRLVGAGLAPGVAADDGVGLHYRGVELVDVVSVRPGARAYRVEKAAGGEVVESALEARLIGQEADAGRTPSA
jgi:peptidase E